jgi:hypothetical protein
LIPSHRIAMSDDTQTTAQPTGSAGGDPLQSIVQHDTSGWIGAAISLVVTLVVGAIAVYQAWQAGKAKAEALHEADVTAEQLKEHQADVVNAQGAEAVAAALGKVNDAEDKIQEINQKIDQLTQDHKNAISQIKAITSWNSFIVVRRDNAQPVPSPSPVPANPFDS